MPRDGGIPRLPRASPRRRRLALGGFGLALVVHAAAHWHCQRSFLGPSPWRERGLGEAGREQIVERWPGGRGPRRERAEPAESAERTSSWTVPPALLAAAAALAAAALPLGAEAAGSPAPAPALDAATAAKFFAAGGLCCCISHAVAVPLDVVKTRQQADPGRYSDASTGRPLGIAGTAAQIVQEEGPGMLLQGLGSTSAGYLVQGAFKYGLWEVFKAALGFGAAVGGARVATLVASAFAAEMVASTLLCPFERARIRLVAEPGFAEGLPSALARLLRERGPVDGLFGEGLAPTLVKMTAYTTAQLTTFTLLSEALSGVLPPGAPRLALTLPSALAAGLVASVASQPGDALQTCTSTSAATGEDCPVDVGRGAPPGLLELAAQLGLSGLFTGWQARLLQMEVIVVTQLLVYDAIKSLVGL